MTKAELIDQMAKVAEVNKKKAEKVLSAFVQVVTENLSKGDEVLLVGFGNFIVRERSEREGHNPKTGEKVHVPACRVPASRPGKMLRDAVNK